MKQNLQKNKGFALLFSVLIASLLLTIGLSIFNITLKELAISTATRQSIYSFFAADSGREYVIYKDTKVGDLIDFDVTDTTLDRQDVSGSDISLTDDADGPYYNFQVTKEWNNDFSAVLTTVTVQGYDNISDDRVERSIVQTY